eukprot:scaffold13136_cov63-Phaeocystis_antarctica.AAC.4
MSATGEKLKPASSMTRTHSALVNVVKSVKQTRKLRALQLRPGPSKRAQWLLLVLGLDPSRSIWGLKPYDLKWPGRDSEAWFQQVVHNTGAAHGRHHSGQALPFYEVILAPAAHQNALAFPAPTLITVRQVPHARLVWGDFQHEIHPCAATEA